MCVCEGKGYHLTGAARLMLFVHCSKCGFSFDVHRNLIQEVFQTKQHFSGCFSPSQRSVFDAWESIKVYMWFMVYQAILIRYIS